MRQETAHRPMRCDIRCRGAAGSRWSWGVLSKRLGRRVLTVAAARSLLIPFADRGRPPTPTLPIRDYLPTRTVTLTWQRARAVALSPEAEASPLARTPYDLRHAAVSRWLAAGVP
jgi:integrase